MNNSEVTCLFDNLIERTVGVPIDCIKNQSSGQLQRHIEEKGNCSLSLGNGTPSSLYRGNMLLALGQVINDIDTKFNQTFGIDG